MNGKDGKPFKTRDGGVMRLENLIADIDEEMFHKIVENRSVKDQDAKETAEIVGLSAIKYGDLSNQATKDYVFDIDRFTSFEGNTGPYILYTIVRIKSILNRYKEEGGNLDVGRNPSGSKCKPEKPDAWSLPNSEIRSKMHLKKKHLTRFVHIFMKYPMHLTVSIMKQRSSVRKIRHRKNLS